MSDELPYNENDGYVGFWVNKRPYNVTGSTYFNSGRDYLTPNKLTKNKFLGKCQNPVSQYFNVAPLPGERAKWARKPIPTSNVYMEGRRFYITDEKRDESDDYVGIPDIKLIDNFSVNFSQFNDAKIYLHSLVCSQISSSVANFNVWIDIFKVLTTESKASCPTLCTEFGCKIAKSLIKVAALRIFANPEQSIMEIPVNSIDSYKPESRVGKFGMGFFSFLYWLIDHPLRALHIYSWSKGENGAVCGYHATVKDSGSEGLTLSVKILETCVTQTGTLMYLDCKKDKFDENTQTKFYNQMQRLKNISSVKIYCSYLSGKMDSTLDSHVFSFKHHSIIDPLINTASKSAKDSVYVYIGSTRIFVEDYAQGIHLNVLLGSLFVPSISTKTIKASIFQKRGSADVSFMPSRFQASFEILVSDVSVVSLKIVDHTCDGAAVISMPSWTRLPVSRDDIILEDSSTAKIFEDAVLKLLEFGAAPSTQRVKSIQVGLQSYIEYTANSINKQIVSNALSIFAEKYKSFLVTDDLYESLKEIDKKCILSDVMYIPDVEARLIDEFSDQLLTNVWYGKRVFLMDNMTPSISTQNMSSLVFVDKKLTLKQKDWSISGSQAFPSLNLNPINTNYGTVQNELYAKYVPIEIKNISKNSGSKIHEELYMAVIAVFDGLKIKFKSLQNILYNFSLLYTNVLLIYGLEEWVKVSYTLLSTLTSYKGNQTYGGEQYKMVIINTSFRENPSKNSKLMKYDAQSIIEVLKSVDEKEYTNFRMVNILSPSQIESEYLQLDKISNSLLTIYTPFHDFLVQNTDKLIDYTICSFVFLKALRHNMLQSNLPVNYDKLTRIGYIIINKIKSLRYTLTDLKNMYTVANDSSNIWNMGLLIYLNLEKLINQIKFLIEISSHPSGDFPYNFSKNITLQHISDVRISQLIGYLFSVHLRSASLTETGIRDLLVEAGKYTGSTKLQITEIAINEGTTKDFISACLTELTQNSVDAIRESDNKNRNININFGKTEDGCYSFMVEDFVGMPPSAFLHVSIPFLSTKTPSEIVTGEMGSGFFNVYRESSLVVIDTVYNGMNYISYDTPVIENGRVVDVVKKIYAHKSSGKNGTKIIVKSHKISDEIMSENIGSLQYITESIISQISLFNDIDIYINGKKSILRSTDKTHMFSVGYFDVYFIKNTKYPSYVFTKGIPFAPLTNFYGKYDKTVLIDIENTIIVNIRHGGYTPVQTRTRLNLPEEISKQFGLLLTYIVFVKNLELSVNDVFKQRDWAYPNLSSDAMANQLVKYEHIAMIHEPSVNFLNYINFDLLETNSFSSKNTLTYHTNMLIKALGDENPRDKHVMERLKKEISKFNLSQYPAVRTFGEFMLLKWISNKNKNIPRSPQKTGGTKKPVRDIKPDKPDKLMEPYVKIWTETFRDKALECGIRGWKSTDKFTIEVGESEEFEASLGYFDKLKNLLYINTITWTTSDRENIVKLVKNIKSTFEFQNLSNDKWVRYFSFRYPASTIPHELEHFRRKSSHEGAHDITRDALWDGDIAHERTFDQSCNDVFSKVISKGFYDELLKRYKAAKLV